jgi:hypothetical protein
MESAVAIGFLKNIKFEDVLQLPRTTEMRSSDRSGEFWRHVPSVKKAEVIM